MLEIVIVYDSSNFGEQTWESSTVQLTKVFILDGYGVGAVRESAWLAEPSLFYVYLQDWRAVKLLPHNRLNSSCLDSVQPPQVFSLNQEQQQSIPSFVFQSWSNKGFKKFVTHSNALFNYLINHHSLRLGALIKICFLSKHCAWSFCLSPLEIKYLWIRVRNSLRPLQFHDDIMYTFFNNRVMSHSHGGNAWLSRSWANIITTNLVIWFMTALQPWTAASHENTVSSDICESVILDFACRLVFVVSKSQSQATLDFTSDPQLTRNAFWLKNNENFARWPHVYQVLPEFRGTVQTTDTSTSLLSRGVSRAGTSYTFISIRAREATTSWRSAQVQPQSPRHGLILLLFMNIRDICSWCLWWVPHPARDWLWPLVYITVQFQLRWSNTCHIHSQDQLLLYYVHMSNSLRLNLMIPSACD